MDFSGEGLSVLGLMLSGVLHCPVLVLGLILSKSAFTLTFATPIAACVIALASIIFVSVYFLPIRFLFVLFLLFTTDMQC